MYGISIASLAGPNGLLTQAEEAKRLTEESEQKEREGLDELSNYINENSNKGPEIQVVEGVVGENSWYTSDVKLKILKNKNSNSRITYELNGATNKEESEISEELIVIANEGKTTIKAYEYDENNERKTTVMEIKKDSIAPTIDSEEEKIVNINTKIDENLII